MNNLRINYERILEVLRKVSTDRQLSMQRRRPVMSDFTPENVHDIHYLEDISDQFSDYIVLGGKGYLFAAVQTTKRNTNINSACSENLESESKNFI